MSNFFHLFGMNPYNIYNINKFIIILMTLTYYIIVGKVCE